MTGTTMIAGAFGCLVTLAAAAALVCRIGIRDAYERGQLDERIGRNSRQIREREEERAWDEWMAKMRDASLTPPWDGETWEISPPPAPRAPTETGALRALEESTDAFIARVAAEEEAYRRALTS